MFVVGKPGTAGLRFLFYSHDSLRLRRAKPGNEPRVLDLFQRVSETASESTGRVKAGSDELTEVMLRISQKPLLFRQKTSLQLAQSRPLAPVLERAKSITSRARRFPPSLKVPVVRPLRQNSSSFFDASPTAR